MAEVEGIAEEGSLLNAVNKLIETTETENREKALNDLRNIIIEKHQIFDNFDMHDAQEFLQILLQNLAVRYYNCNKLYTIAIIQCNLLARVCCITKSKVVSRVSNKQNLSNIISTHQKMYKM